MHRETEFSACLDVLAARLPGMALYELSLDEPVSAFQEALFEVTHLNVRQKLTEAGIDVIGVVKQAMEGVLAEKGMPPDGMGFVEWIDIEFRERVNPLREHVRQLLHGLALPQE